MRILVLWASEANPNLGVRTLARGSRDLLLRAWPDAVFTYADFGQRPSEVPWGRVRSLLRERATGRLGMQKFLAGFDLIWDTRSGDSFSDIYGLGRLTVMSSVHEFARQAGTAVVMAPQTIGPFRTRRGRLLAKRTLRRSNLVLARDPRSASEASRLGRPADATVTDLAFGIDAPAVGPMYDIILNVSGLLWNANPHVSSEIYRAAVRAIIVGLLEEGRKVTLLAHVLDSGNRDNDVPAAKALIEEFSGRIDVVIPRDLDEARSVIASAQLVVAARMHACLNALSVGVPAIAMAYSRKFGPLLASIGWIHVVDIGDAAVVSNTVLDLARRKTLKDQAEVSRSRARALLNLSVPLIAALRRSLRDSNHARL